MRTAMTGLQHTTKSKYSALFEPLMGMPEKPNWKKVYRRFQKSMDMLCDVC